MWFFLFNLEYFNGCGIYFKIHQDSFFCNFIWFDGFWCGKVLSSMKVVFWFNEKDLPIDYVSWIFVNVRRATENHCKA